MPTNPVTTPCYPDYVAKTVSVGTTPKRIIDILAAAFPGVSYACAYREVQIQLDPITNANPNLYVGDSTVGTTVAGLVQKGVVLTPGGQDTWRAFASQCNLAAMYVVAASGTSVFNVHLMRS